MKIVLSTVPSEGQFVNWTTHKYFRPDKVNKYMPLGILSLASNLPEDIDIKVLDPPSEGWSIDKTIDKIESEEPDILGLSVVTRRAYSMKQILRRVNVPYKIVGGPHATYHSQQILDFGADMVLAGSLTEKEFNYTIKHKLEGVMSCYTKINEIKFPKRDFLDVNRYYPKESTLFKAENRLPMFSSIGCPNRCVFCNVQSKKVQYKNSKIILDEMEYLQSIGCKSIHMLDDNFNINRKHVSGILDEMNKRDFNMEWSGRGQVKMDYNLLPRLRDSGFKRIHVGIEAIEDKILKFLNKNEKVSDVERFCKACKESNIDILGYLILGSPVETREYRKRLPDMIRDLDIKYPFINVLFPEPDTDYYNMLVEKGIYKRDYWKEYMVNPIPDYEIPYPYGEDKKEEIFNDVEEIVDEFR